MSYQTSSKRSPPFWLLTGARKLVFFLHQSETRTAATLWNWSGKTLSPGALLAILYFSSFHIYFSAHLDFPSSPLSAPGSPRMDSQPLFGIIQGLVFAGIADLARPADKLSPSQSTALAATGNKAHGA